jgi:uncharacterized protein (TIGR02217 family)
MAYPIMPPMPLAMSKGLRKSPVFNSVVQRPVAGRSVAAFSLIPYPCWAFEFDMDKIQANEALAESTLMQFLGTMMLVKGRAGLWLFTDPQDNSVTYANSGMLNVTPGATTPMGSKGDGSSNQFQLARSIGGLAWDIIQNLNGSITVKVNGSTETNCSVSSTGVVTFAAGHIPGSDAVLTWQGSFYYLCRFDEDTVDATRVFTMNSGTDIWDVNSIKYTSEFV